MKYISIFSRLFQTAKSGQKATAAVFVDYEHWFISLEKLFGIKPDVKAWSVELHEKYDVRSMTFFADFSHESMQGEISKIREVSNMIVQTQNTNHYKKDFTDFIMLDEIYQTAVSKHSPDVFILFTGDGHFCSVVRFLCNQCGKTVGVYGVKNAFSKQLKTAATWDVEVEKPAEPDPLEDIYKTLLRNFRYHDDQKEKKILTFKKTVEYVARRNHLPFKKVTAGLKALTDKGYVYTKQDVYDGNHVTTLAVNWDLVKKDKLQWES